ncbi:hypothetical protein [Wielerella bovis]|nr:hypothetical protein [Wielerella bovis]MCG7657327.1 hypothetical protein [Wielerella bovis]MCG7659549.1 hypothetical protein [Wielerella bovis]
MFHAFGWNRPNGSLKVYFFPFCAAYFSISRKANHSQQNTYFILTFSV